MKSFGGGVLAATLPSGICGGRQDNTYGRSYQQNFGMCNHKHEKKRNTFKNFYWA